MRRDRDLLLGLLVMAGAASMGYGCSVIAGLKDREELAASTSSSGGGGSGGSGGSTTTTTSSGGGMGGSGGGTTTTGGGGGSGGAGGGGGNGGAGGGCDPVLVAAGQVSPTAIFTTYAMPAVYWATTGMNADDNGIWMAPKPCGPAVRLAFTNAATTLQTPVAITADSVNVYWSDMRTGSCVEPPQMPPYNLDRIMRIARDGTADPTMPIEIDTFCGRANSLAYDGNRVYWARPTTHYIQSRLKNLSMGTQTVHYDVNVDPFAIAMDDSSTLAYWTSGALQTVFTADMTTAFPVTPSTFATTMDSTDWVGVDNQSVYWTASTQVMKLDRNMAGGMPTQLYMDLGAAAALAVDPNGSAVYVADSVKGDILRIEKDGSGGTAIEDTVDALSGVAVDETYVYWTDTTTGEIKRAPK